MAFTRKTPLTAEAVSVQALIAGGRDRAAWPAFAAKLYADGRLAYYVPDRTDDRPVGLSVGTTFRSDVIGKADDMIVVSDDGVIDVRTAQAFAAAWQEG